MTRAYAQFQTAIWRPDNEFRQLPPDAQHVYFMLSSQADITAAGTLPLTINRWSQNASGLTVRSVKKSLGVLTTKRYIVIDEETEELLIRTFIKADGGYKNDTRSKAIRDAIQAVASPALRSEIGHELRKLGLTVLASLVPSDAPSHDPPDDPSNGRADAVSDDPSYDPSLDPRLEASNGTPRNRRVVVT